MISQNYPLTVFAIEMDIGNTVVITTNVTFVERGCSRGGWTSATF